MKKCLIIFSFVFCLFLNSISYANWVSDLISVIEKTNGIDTSILDSQNASLNTEKDILSSQKEVEDLMRQVNGNLSGISWWGTYHSHDYQS